LALSEVLGPWIRGRLQAMSLQDQMSDFRMTGRGNGTTGMSGVSVDGHFPWPQAVSGVLVIVSFLLLLPRSDRQASPPLQEL